jgi:hypothetical protein
VLVIERSPEPNEARSSGEHGWVRTLVVLRYRMLPRGSRLLWINCPPNASEPFGDRPEDVRVIKVRHV